ncbi:universal stress protein [Gallaecimonas sp. GXIMD1310]|uniref:universal stress protein n=1 Tax=Gallaecimonas sp. GXIMD1310 TaxID=3131926 RepID=UPI0032527210
MTMHVMACIDGSAHSAAVSQYAAWAAGQLQTPLTLLHILDHHHGEHAGDFSGAIGLGAQEALIEEMVRLDEQRSKLAMAQGQQMLDGTKASLADSGLTIDCRQRHGELVASISDIEADIRLLVVGKRGAADHAHADELGMHVERLIRAMHKPVLLTPAAFSQPSSVLVAFDGSQTTCKGVEMVANSPLFKGLPCHVVMVADSNADNQAQLDWALVTLRAQGHQAQGAIISGDVEKVLSDYQQQHETDMLVMGAYGHSRVRQFLVGSTTTAMIRHSRTPVLLLR